MVQPPDATQYTADTHVNRVQPPDATQYTADTHVNRAEAVKPIWQSIAVHITGLALFTVGPTARNAVTIC